MIKLIVVFLLLWSMLGAVTWKFARDTLVFENRYTHMLVVILWPLFALLTVVQRREEKYRRRMMDPKYPEVDGRGGS